jgi:hypothetical protein
VFRADGHIVAWSIAQVGLAKSWARPLSADLGRQGGCAPNLMTSMLYPGALLRRVIAR